MTRNARIGFLLAAVVVLVAAFVIIGTGGDDDEAEVAATPTATATGTASRDTGPYERPTPEPTPTPPPIPRVVVEGGKPADGVEEIEVDKGDRIRFVVAADTADEIHVHGFDLYADVAPGKPARFDFEADADGIYEVEMHGTGEQIAELRINP